jgi:hypothetical protein
MPARWCNSVSHTPETQREITLALLLSRGELTSTDGSAHADEFPTGVAASPLSLTAGRQRSVRVAEVAAFLNQDEQPKGAKPRHSSVDLSRGGDLPGAPPNHARRMSKAAPRDDSHCWRRLSLGTRLTPYVRRLPPRQRTCSGACRSIALDLRTPVIRVYDSPQPASRCPRPASHSTATPPDATQCHPAPEVETPLGAPGPEQPCPLVLPGWFLASGIDVRTGAVGARSRRSALRQGLHAQCCRPAC